MFFDVINKPQTWRNAGYLLLAFPLGIFYFVFIVTGLSLGLGLFITLLGIPVLIGVLVAVYGMGEFERMTTNALLHLDTEPANRLGVSGGLWPKLKALVGSSETWKRLGYLLIEFPLGIVGFTLATTTAALFALILTPFLYGTSWWPTAADWPSSYWSVDTFSEGVVVAIVGVLAGFLMLHVMNGVARLWGDFATTMLGPTRRPAVSGATDQTEQVLEDLGV